MDNREIEQIITRNERGARVNAFFTPALWWLSSAAFLGFGFILDAPISFWTLAFTFFVLGAYEFVARTRKLERGKNRATRAIWEKLGADEAFGPALSASTRQLGGAIQGVYDLDPAGEILPLRQAMRLLDTHKRQQARLRIVNARLEELRALRLALSEKIAQLRALGENHLEGARNLEQVKQDYAALQEVSEEIQRSCHRLEMIVISVQKAAQARRLHRELNELSSRVSRPTPAAEPAFAAESLEDIERQIAREIETYLQLERETDEHLR